MQMDNPDSVKQTDGAQSIRRAVAILRILASGQERGVRLTDIVNETKLTRSTVHRILRVLVEERTVAQDPETRRYLIGDEVLFMGLARNVRLRIKTVAAPFLERIAQQIGDTVFLTIRNGYDSLCVDRKLGSYPIKVLSIEVGARRPFGIGVGSLALLSFLSDKEVADIVATNRPRLARSGLTEKRLLEQIRETRERGYAYAEDAVVKGTKAIGVAVLNDSGEPVAGLSVVAIKDRLPQAQVPKLARLLLKEAQAITVRLTEARRKNR
jgi:DNA-binding IclR family transcriptional regulator